MTGGRLVAEKSIALLPPPGNKPLEEFRPFPVSPRGKEGVRGPHAARSGRLPSSGAPPSLPTAAFFQFRFDCSQQFRRSASHSKLTPRYLPIRCVLVQFWYSGTHERDFFFLTRNVTPPESSLSRTLDVILRNPLLSPTHIPGRSGGSRKLERAYS